MSEPRFRIHLGHHFFGAGNRGDDWMLAGFLEAWRPWLDRVSLTCPTPHPLGPLAARFPRVRWLPYDEAGRRESIRGCDAWLGLGGSPFQCAVSRWFVDHLAWERAQCEAAGRPMYFLGVGGQDPEAYGLPENRQLCAQAAGIWCRDERSAEAVAAAVPSARVRLAADLSHLFFAAGGAAPARGGLLTAVLNMDYRGWPGLAGAMAALAGLPARERLWVAQESRPLPGAELWLFEQLTAEQRAGWSLVAAGDRETGTAWPAGEWLLTSRFHATLAGAWAGSRAVVLATNEKLVSVARLCGYPLLGLDRGPRELLAALDASAPPQREGLVRLAAAARQACDELARALRLARAPA